VAVDLLARDRMKDFQELAHEAFQDLLDKYGRQRRGEGTTTQLGCVTIRTERTGCPIPPLRARSQKAAAPFGAAQVPH
jgi:hypothetical protein